MRGRKRKKTDINKKLKIPIPLYKMALYVWFCNSKQAEEYYKTTVYHEMAHDTVFESKSGKCLTLEGYDPVIWIDSSLPKADLIGAFAHEVFHAIHHELQRRGLKCSLENEEAYAYMIEYTMTTIVEALKL